MRSGLYKHVLVLAVLPATTVALILGGAIGWQGIMATQHAARDTARIEAAAMARHVAPDASGRPSLPARIPGGDELAEARLLGPSGRLLSWRNRLDLQARANTDASYLMTRLGGFFLPASDLRATAKVPRSNGLEVRVALIEPPWKEDAGRSILLAAAATAAGLILATLLGLLLGTGLTARLRAIGRQLARLTHGEYDNRLPPYRAGELGRIASDLNRLADILARRQPMDAQAQPAERSHADTGTDTHPKQFESLLHSLDHELRSPLNAINGYAQLLDKEPLSASQKESLAVMRSAVDTITQLLEDMLQPKRSGRRGRRSRVLQTFDLVGLIDETILFTAPAAYAKGLDLIADCGGWRSLPLTGNTLHLRQILTNLLGNAVKYTPQGQVRLQLEVGSTEGDKLQLALHVIDTGPGIAPQHRERVFQENERLKATSGLPGKGLGLALSQRLAREMGGQILLDEPDGGGCRFTLKITLNHAESYAASQPPSPTPMLLWEPDAEIRNALAHRLCAAGGELELATGKEDLLRRLGDDADGNAIGILSLAPGEHPPEKGEIPPQLRVLACTLDTHGQAGTAAPKCIGQQRLEELLGLPQAQKKKTAQSYLSPRLWRILCEDMPIDLDRLATALRNSDLDDARSAVHRICGTTSFVRMHESEKAARQLEGTLRMHDVSPALAWKQLKSLSHTILRELRRIAPPVTQRSLASWRIMVVDDNRLNAELLARHLESHGAVVDHFGTAEEARSAAGPWHAILVDVQLAEESGIKLGSELQSRFQRALLVAQSGDTQASTRNLASRSGFHDYLTKPIDLEQLPDRLRTLRASLFQPTAQQA